MRYLQFLTACALASMSAVCHSATLPEIEGPRAAYQKALAKIRADRDRQAAIANRTYASSLERLHKKLTEEGETNAAAAVKAEQERFAKGDEPTGEQRRKMTGLLLALRVAYEKERSPAYIPAKRLEAHAHAAWAAGLAQLQTQFARTNQLAKAAIVQAERDKLNQSAEASPAVAPPGEQKLDAALANRIKTSLLASGPVLTETSGPKKGASNVPDDGAVLIGFEVSEFAWRGKSVKALDPIFLTKDGIFRGEMRGKPSNSRTVVQARAGYAVGGLNVHSHDRVAGLQVVFMKMDPTSGRLNTEDSYLSPWYGTHPSGASIRLGCDGRLVVGVHGAMGADADTIGLAMLP